MATLAVAVKRLTAPVEHHPNADGFSIVRGDGFCCIAAKLDDGAHRFAEGDHVAYIPEASVLPEALLRAMGFWKSEADGMGKGTLAGAQGNRVEAFELLGVFSQGLVFPVSAEPGIFGGAPGELTIRVPIQVGDEIAGAQTYVVVEGGDIAGLLGITSYEPPAG